MSDGPFPAHPPGDTLFGPTRRHSSSPYLSVDTTRRRSLIGAENRVVAGSLVIRIGSYHANTLLQPIKIKTNIISGAGTVSSVTGFIYCPRWREDVP